MNRSAGMLESSPVQQMIAGSPNCNWWSSSSISVNNMRQPISQQPPSPNFLLPPLSNHFPHYITAPPPPPLPTTSSSISLPLSSSNWQHNQELPESWSQLLLGGLVGEEDKSGLTHIADQAKRLENWEEQILQLQAPNTSEIEIKQENSASSFAYGTQGNVEYQAAPKPTWSQMMPISSPKTCATSLSGNMLDFSNKADGRRPPPDECNSTAAGGAVKKPRVHQPPSTHSTFKVRKEKLGDRITALHQLVSPFGKTDTASVLLEAIGYIRFLQSQIEALSLPYLGSGAGNVRQHQSVQGERNCLFPEDPGQLLNDNSMKRKGASEQEYCNEEPKDLRTRGLCLVPLSCTLQVGSDNGADYWAPAALGGGFR